MLHKLLIIDDERKTREGLKKVINWNKYNIIQIATAEDGVEALELFNSFSPDIILCDVRMPKMDGIEFAKPVPPRFIITVS